MKAVKPATENLYAALTPSKKRSQIDSLESIAVPCDLHSATSERQGRTALRF